MLQLAEREGLAVAEIRRESHSAKSTGQRPVYNELLVDIRQRKFGGILTRTPPHTYCGKGVFLKSGSYSGIYGAGWCT